MSGQTTTWFRQRRQLLVFNGTPLGFTSLSVALTRRVPASNAAANQLDEAGAYGYTRVSVPLNSSNWSLVNGTEMANTYPIVFPRASGGGWGTLHGWALIAEGPNAVCAVGTISEPLRAIGGIQPVISAGGIVFGEHD